MDEFGVTFDEMVKKEKEKAVADLKQQVSSPPSSSTAVVVENVNSSNLHNTEVITSLQPVTPVSGTAVTGKLNSSDLVVNVNPSRVRLSVTTSQSELPISCSIVDGKCLPVTDTGHSSGFNIVVDNWDMRQEVRNMSAEHQNADIHWVNHNIVENRVSGNHLPDDKPIKDIKDLQNKDLLPSTVDHKALYDNYIIHIQRILVKRILSLKCLDECAQKHIVHKHSKEMIRGAKRFNKNG